MHNLDAYFFAQVDRGLKFCSYLLENSSPHVPTRCLRDFSVFSVCSSNILLLLRVLILPIWWARTSM
jgi:hypothetical protein